jgi:homocysteine S-methyltransferase
MLSDMGVSVIGNSVVERCEQAGDEAVFVCDFSPPRGGDPALLSGANEINADFISVAYNPGKSPRLNPITAAHWIRQNTGQDALFTVSTRDLNRMAMQGILLGADLLGLRNVVVVKGDPYRGRELEWAVPVDDYTPTGLIASINGLNEGLDFKGLKLRSLSRFCVGATIDLGMPLERQLRLTHRKVESGAKFFLLQALFEPERLTAFTDAYAEAYGEALTQPIFCGVQVLVPDGITFGEMPGWVTDGLAKGRDGVEIAVELIGRYADAGHNKVYLVPPIFKGGRRDYASAARVMQAFGR